MATKAISADFKGGGALARHLRTIESHLGSGAQVQVGFLESATYPERTEELKKAGHKIAGKNAAAREAKNTSRAGLHVAQVAFWQEYGTATSPERPFIRDMVEKRSPRWGVTLGNILRKNHYEAERSLALMGEVIKGQMVQSINNWSSPPNADSTVERKGFNKPLVDTAVMLRSVDYQVLAGSGMHDND